jgi:hypothetical protein
MTDPNEELKNAERAVAVATRELARIRFQTGYVAHVGDLSLTRRHDCVIFKGLKSAGNDIDIGIGIGIDIGIGEELAFLIDLLKIAQEEG